VIEVIFTLDYEIFGNGEGSLRELVLEPTRHLVSLFAEQKVPFVLFAEAAELEKMELHGVDGIGEVQDQIRKLYHEGIEIGLHLHPQWCNARPSNGGWRLDPSEYNLCTLSPERVNRIVGRSIEYLRKVTADPGFVPISFRAGNWLLQPTGTVAPILARHGVRIDSSVFKGGRQRNHKLDYRPALKNGYYWHFTQDVNKPDPAGRILEIPIHTELRPFWKMLTLKRISLQKRNAAKKRFRSQMNRLFDFAHFYYPLKLDFCRLAFDDLRSLINGILREEERSENKYKPIVAIGHSKDLVDYESIGKFLLFLRRKSIPVSTFKAVLPKSQSPRVDATQC
jgi:hypothetical protein